MNDNIMLMWSDAHGHYASDAHSQIKLDQKPQLSFEYETLVCYSNRRVKGVWVTESSNPGNPYIVIKSLSDDEIEECEKFVRDLRGQCGHKVLAVDELGVFLGEVDQDDPRIKERVFAGPPGHDHFVWDFSTKWWRLIRGVDADGNYIGNVDPKECSAVVRDEPPTVHHKWSFEESRWVDRRPVDLISEDTMSRINLHINGLRNKELKKHGKDRYLDIMKEVFISAKQIYLREGLKNLADLEDLRISMIEESMLALSEEDVKAVESISFTQIADIMSKKNDDPKHS